MNTTWIVAANGGRARIFADEDRAGALQEINDMINPAARNRTSDEVTDRPGPTAAGKSIHGTGGALPSKQYEPPQTPDEREAEAFAREICAYLLQAQHEGRFQHLALVAAPRFLGALRLHLDARLKPCVNTEIDKDYTGLSAHQLREQLAALASRGDAAASR